MNFTPEQRKKISLWVIGLAAACILIFFGVRNIDQVASALKWVSGLIFPLILGFAFALIINVPMRFFEGVLWRRTKKKFLQKMRRVAAYIISFLLIIGVIVGIVVLVIPSLSEAVSIIIQGVSDIVTRISAMESNELKELPFYDLIVNIDWQSLIDDLQHWLRDSGGVIVDTAVGTIGALVSSVFDFFVAFIFSIYVLFNKEKLKERTVEFLRVWLGSGFTDKAVHVGRVASKNFSSFISGQSLEAVILGLLCMLGMLIFQIPYAPTVGALVGVTALIPVMGAFIGVFVGAFIILTVDPFKALIFIIFIIILQQIEGNVIYPRVMGSSVNLPSMWVLAAVTVGGGVAGPIGMLLSVPICSTLYILLWEATEARKNKLK